MPQHQWTDWSIWFGCGIMSKAISGQKPISTLPLVWLSTFVHPSHSSHQTYKYLLAGPPLTKNGLLTSGLTRGFHSNQFWSPGYRTTVPALSDYRITNCCQSATQPNGWTFQRTSRLTELLAVTTVWQRSPDLFPPLSHLSQTHIGWDLTKVQQ